LEVFLRKKSKTLNELTAYFMVAGGYSHGPFILGSLQSCNRSARGPTLARSSTAMSIATIFCFYREVKAGLNRGQR
jgi:hypothetical protein